MLLATIPQNEPQRIVDVYDVNLLDSEQEERFDRLTRIAHHLFDIKFTFIALVDSERTWFKSRHGTNVIEAPRQLSYCGHAINNNISDDPVTRLFEVVDAKKDIRFYDNPYIMEKCKAVYYLGFTLLSPNRHKIGTLCMTDTRPRTFSDDQKQLFIDLGFMAEAELNAKFSGAINNKHYLFNSSNECCSAQKIINQALAIDEVENAFNISFKKHGIKFSDWRVLNEIYENNQETASAISKKMQISSSLLTSKLDKLQKKGLIRRCHSKGDDRRLIYLESTEQGCQLRLLGMNELVRVATP